MPSLFGVMVFFFIPFATSIFYAFTDVRGEFAWFANFSDVLRNVAFRLAARNSLWFIAVSVPLNIVISFMLASLLHKIKYRKILTLAFMLPLVVPSGAVVFFWNVIFADNGAINSLLFRMGLTTVPWLSTDWSFAIILLVFLFRTIGFNLVLYVAGMSLVPSEYYEAAKVEGAGGFAILRHVTFIYTVPTSFVVLMMSIINSFRVFREIYLLYGPYPHMSVYMLQHFMNNQFVFANLQRLSVTAILLSVVILVLVVGVFTGQRKISDTFS